VRFTIEDPKGVALNDKGKKLIEYIQSPSVTLYFKDLGPQISWKTVFLVEYGGPIVITLCFWLLRKQIYGSNPEMTLNQKLGVFMALFHYCKRELETLLVHKFSADTMPLSNIFKNSFHYFGLFGFLTMYFYLHPDYTPPAWANDTTYYIFLAFFLFCEFMNLMCHITLSNLRPAGTTTRGIPKGWGFGLVSCANYFWEFLAWVTFTVQAQTIGGYVFLAASTYQMLEWAFKKHKRYK
jgi:very-long-chain enoyl-CoA reductase